jgi:hypothetical protein
MVIALMMILVTLVVMSVVSFDSDAGDDRSKDKM